MVYGELDGPLDELYGFHHQEVMMGALMVALMVAALRVSVVGVVALMMLVLRVGVHVVVVVALMKAGLRAGVHVVVVAAMRMLVLRVGEIVVGRCRLDAVGYHRKKCQISFHQSCSHSS